MRHKVMQLIIATATAAGVCTVAFAVSGPAYAAQRTHTPSSSFAGWSGFTNGGGWTTAAGKLTLPPTITCPSAGSAYGTFQIAWSASQPSSGSAELDASISCYMGTPSLSASVREFDATGSELRYLPVAPGDTLGVALSPSASGFQVTGRNVTKGQTATVHGYSTSLTWTYASYGFNAFSPPIPTFTTAKFSGLTLGGQPAATVLGPSLTGYDLYNGSHELVAAGALTSTAFSDKFLAST